MDKWFDPGGPLVDCVLLNEESAEVPGQKELKSYSDAYLYSKYPLYNKKLTDAIMQDPIIDKSTDAFADVEHEIKRTRVSDGLVRILKSANVVLLDCDDPLPKAFKVFCARDFKSPDKRIKVFIDCSGVITKAKTSSALMVDEMKLVSYLVDAAICMVYHKQYSKIQRQNSIVVGAATCFAKCFTFVIDYITKVSIQETSKAKVLYLSATYFLQGVMGFDDDKSHPIAKKIAEISDREADMLNLLMDKASRVKDVSNRDTDPYANIKSFVNALREVMHFNSNSVTLDTVVERWMTQYGVGTVLGMEYFPAFSAMMTDCYNGAYLNNQRSIESVCKVDMVKYAKDVIAMIDTIA